MAGIGFELKKLFVQKSTFGYLKGSLYTAVIAVGPIFLTAAMILIIQMLMKMAGVSYYASQVYLASVIYPFVFSQIIASGFAMFITRFVADKLFSRKYADIVPSLYGIVAIALLVGAVPSVIFFWNSSLPIEIRVAAYLLYMELIVIWIEGVYLTALKDYSKIIRSYAVGTFVSIVLAYAAIMYGDRAAVSFQVLLALDTGFYTILTMLMINITKFFSQAGNKNFLFLYFLDKYIKIFFTNFFYTLSLYIPNIIIWFGTMGVCIAGTYLVAPAYDVASFYAFLSILPTMTIFVVSTELVFYEKYITYFKYITGKGIYKDIDDARNDMLRVMWSEIRHIIEFQLVFSLFFIAIGNFALPKLGLSPESIDIYNMLVLGACSTGLIQVIIVVLLYFEDQKGVLYTSGIFLVSNVIFNLLSLQVGPNTYGFGLFLSAFLSLILALARLSYYTKRIDYYVFCSQEVFVKPLTGIFTKIANRLYKNNFQEQEE